MAVGPASVARPAPALGRATSRRSVLEREWVFSWLMLAPGVLFLLAFVAYPFFYGIFLSLQDRRVASTGTFVGLANFVTLTQDPVFWQVTRNTFVYTIVATILKMVGGLALALVMNQHFRGRNLARAFLLLPFIVPTVLSTIAWMWILDPTFSVVNWTLRNSGLVTQNFSWLGNATLAMVSIIVVNTWRGLPFYGITLLAGLQTIPPDLYEAAAIDGASLTQRFWHITMPVIKPVLIIVTMFSIIFTFSDFQLVYAVEARPELGDDVRPAGATVEEVRAEQAGRGPGPDADLDLDARVAEAAHTGAGDVRIGILDGDDDAADAGGDERIRTRASTTVMGAGFERDDGGRPGGR